LALIKEVLVTVKSHSILSTNIYVYFWSEVEQMQSNPLIIFGHECPDKVVFFPEQYRTFLSYHYFY